MVKELTEEQFNDLTRYISKLQGEVKRCEGSGAYLAGCFLAGALLESLLLAMVNCYPEEVERARQSLNIKSKRQLSEDITQWSLSDLLRISFEAGWIPFKGTDEPDEGELGDWLLNFVKELRNWIHPGKKIRQYTRMRITQKRFKAVMHFVDEAKELLLRKVELDILSGIRS